MKTLVRGSDRLYHTTTQSFLVVQCVKCGLMRLYPTPLPSQLHQYYPGDYWYSPEQDASGRVAEFYRRIVLSDHVRFVARAIQESGEKGLVLDVGCGGGLFLRMLRERGFTVAGLDFALSAASVAWRVNGVPAVCGSLGETPIAAGSCAAVTMFHVLEHLYDPAAYPATQWAAGGAGAQCRLLAISAFRRALEWCGYSAAFVAFSRPGSGAIVEQLRL
jgi:SAM-dependent methyltransferase